MLVPIVAYLIFINAATYAVFAYDKTMAQGGQRRVPERTLLRMATAGGSVGAVAAQRILRHKTRKEPFRSILHVIVFLQVVVVLALALVGQDRLEGWFAAFREVMVR